MRISDWSSDVCSSDLSLGRTHAVLVVRRQRDRGQDGDDRNHDHQFDQGKALLIVLHGVSPRSGLNFTCLVAPRSEEHTSELQSLMRISYAVFCLKKKNA